MPMFNKLMGPQIGPQVPQVPQGIPQALPQAPIPEAPIGPPIPPPQTPGLGNALMGRMQHPLAGSPMQNGAIGLRNMLTQHLGNGPAIPPMQGPQQEPPMGDTAAMPVGGRRIPALTPGLQ